jgi:hypothetical protein
LLQQTAHANTALLATRLSPREAAAELGVRTLGSWQLLIAGVGGSAALCGCEVRVSRLLSGVVRLGRLLMNQSTPSRSIPLPLWVTVGFYPFYLILWLGEGYYIWASESKAIVKNWPWLLVAGIIAFAAFGLLSGKPYGRLRAIMLGGSGYPRWAL